MTVLGLDIGGANLKAANSEGRSVSRPFAIWKSPENLADELRLLEGLVPGADEIAVTMTAELADCYATKAEGVARILAAVQEVAGARPVHVWLTSGEFVSPAEAVSRPLAAAASNWHALASWTSRWTRDAPALLLDIGSTTTDLIPIDAGRPSTTGLTDVTRLMAGELFYTGVRRTPLCAVAPWVPFHDTPCPLAAELFATMLDVYLWLGDIPEDETDTETANGRPATKLAAHDRMARQLCCDRLEFDAAAATDMAEHLAERQFAHISSALENVLRDREQRRTVIISGSGSFLARRIVEEHPRLGGEHTIMRDGFMGEIDIIDIAEEISSNLATSACAYAVAMLASPLSPRMRPQRDRHQDSA